MSRKTILIFNEYYLPGYKAGGPIRSLSNLVWWLGDDLHFKIITTNRDLNEKKTYETVKENQWNTVGKAEVYYCSEPNLKISTFYKLLNETDYDLVYLNTLFGIRFSFLPLLILLHIQNFSGEKILLAPRGQLSEGALSQSSLKKKLFLTLIWISGIYNKIKWHATNELEKKEIVNQLGVPTDQVHIASNLPQKIEEDYLQEVRKEQNEIKIVFLSRIDIKKNIIYALRTLKQVKDIRVIFHIYGSVDNKEYWEQCKLEIQTLPQNVTVCYKGFIEHQDVIPTIAKYHLFFLPTKGENFGHAIFEALLAGTPVLISDRTPWLNLKEKDLGWALPLSDRDKFIEVIRSLGDMNEQDLNLIKEKVHNNIKKMNIDKTVKATRSMLKSI